MKLVLRITVTALLAALLAVPAASARPGGGNGHGKGAEKAKAAHALKAGKEKKAKKDKSAKQAGKADKAKKEHGKNAESCEAPSAAAAVLDGLFGSASECAADDQKLEEQAELALEPPDLEGLGPGQYCHQLEAWMAASGGDFSQTFGTEQSGYHNDHGKCASRRAHGEDLLAAATDALPEEEQAQEEELELPNLEGLGPGQYCHQLEAWMRENGGNFSQTFGTEDSGYANDHGKCASRRAHGEDLAPVAQQAVEESKEAEAGAPAAAELTAVLRLLSF